jgi:hypothetical protein
MAPLFAGQFGQLRSQLAWFRRRRQERPDHTETEVRPPYITPYVVGAGFARRRQFSIL